jgi:hypothetical protein
MDALGYLFTKAESEGFLQHLPTRTLQHRVSFYADDVVLFPCQVNEDISITKNIIEIFGEVSGLRNNVNNSSVCW